MIDTKANQINTIGAWGDFKLTTGVDNIVGTAGNDTINGTENATVGRVLGGLDSIDGGAGTDTLNIADANTGSAAAFTFGGATIKNVENISVTTNGGFTGLDVSGIAGLTKFTGSAAGTANSDVTAANTADVNLTVAGAATAKVYGGKAISITAGTGAVTVGTAGAAATKADAITSVSVKGGGAVLIDNTGGALGITTATGTTLTSVTLDNVGGATAGISGGAVAEVTVKNQKTALATTITNATSTALNVNVDGAGYNAAGAAVTGVGTNVSITAGAAAKTITLNATGSKSNVQVAGAAVTTLNITGTAALTLDQPITTATKIDGSAATGALTLGTLNAATVNVSTGSGNDSLTLSATTKATVGTGAGNDSVTLASAVAAGSTVTLGAGDDKLLVSSGSVAASTVTAVTTIDAGEGTDTVAAALINAANAAQFKNFENIDASATATLDVELMTGSTIAGLTLTGGTGGATLSNVAAGVGLSVSGSNSGTTTIGVKGAATGTADSFTTTFAGTAGATATALALDTIAAGTVVANNVETLNVVSGGTGFVTNTLTVTDSALQTLTITGDKGLALTFAGTNGTAVTGVTDTVNGVKSIDGSAATGILNINTTAGTFNVANAGLTIKTGSAKDVITLGQKATVDAGAADDSIVSSVKGGTFTGGTGNDTFNLAATGIEIGGATTEAAGVIKTTIADLSAGDVIKFSTAASAFAATKITLDNTVTTLDAALALASNNTTVGQITWFQYGNSTYIVENADGTTGIDAATAGPTVGDVVIKLTGVIDLSNSTFDNAADTLTIV